MDESTATPMRHHPVAGLFPMMNGLDFATFKEDIRVNGLLDPIWTYREEIIDGRNRERACRELGITPTSREWDGRGSLVAFVVSLNLRRRHLDETQRAVIAAKLKPMLAREAAERKAKPPESSATDSGASCNGYKMAEAGANLRPPSPDLDNVQVTNGRTSHAAAALLNVSPRSVDNAAKVLRDGARELVEAVERGEVAVSVAAAVAELPKREQARAVKAGTVRAAAADVQTAKRQRAAKPSRDVDPAADWATTVRSVRGRIRATLADARFASQHDDWTREARRDWLDALRELIDALRASLREMEANHAPR